jgi:hypothetical protein
MIWGCQKQSSYSLKIEDYPNPLRSKLLSLVESGLVLNASLDCNGTGVSYTTHQQLLYQQEPYLRDSLEMGMKQSLLYSDVPLIRANAVSLLLSEDSLFSHANLVRLCYGDTAMIFPDNSISGLTILSHAVINSNRWISLTQRDSIDRELLQQHPYEYASYSMMNYVRNVDTFPGFYKILRGMVANRHLVENEQWFSYELFMNSVNRLASFHRKEDVELLEEVLEESMRLSKKQFLGTYLIFNNRSAGFENLITGNQEYPFAAIQILRNADKGLQDLFLAEYLEALVSIKNQLVAKQLKKMLTRTPYEFAGGGGIKGLQKREEAFKGYLASIIRKYRCPNYEHLINETTELFKQWQSLKWNDTDFYNYEHVIYDYPFNSDSVKRITRESLDKHHFLQWWR